MKTRKNLSVPSVKSVASDIKPKFTPGPLDLPLHEQRKSRYPSVRLWLLKARLRTAEKKLEILRLNRPCDDRSDRFCRKYMEKFFAMQHKVDRLRNEVDQTEKSVKRRKKPEAA